MNKAPFCVLQELQLHKIMGTVLHNDFDCPLLTLTTNIFIVPSHLILTYVSVIHQCTNTCTIVSQLTSLTQEREQVNQERLFLNHDLSNDLYCLNVYCMNH